MASQRFRSRPLIRTATGADTVVAQTTSVSGIRRFKPGTGFQLTATNVTLTSFTSDSGCWGTLAAYGQTGLTVVLGERDMQVDPVNIVLASSCVNQGKATLTPSVGNHVTTGRAVFTYRDNGCGALAASDTIQASVTGTSLTSSALSLDADTAHGLEQSPSYRPALTRFT